MFTSNYDIIFIITTNIYYLKFSVKCQFFKVDKKKYINKHKNCNLTKLNNFVTYSLNVV